MNSAVRWLYRVLGRKKGYIVALTAVQAVSGALGVVYALLLREIVDSAVGHDAAGFWRNVVLILLLVLVQLSLAALLRWLRELANSSMENLFKQRLVDQLLRKDYASVSAIHTGEWLNRLTNDTRVVTEGLTDILPGLAGTLVRLVSALVMLVAMDRWFARILIPGGVGLMLLTYAFRKTLKKLHKGIQESDGRLRVLLQERLGSLMVIKSFAAEPQVSREAREKMDEHKAARMRRNRFSNLANFGYGAAMRGMYLLGVVYCAHGIMVGRVSYGTLTAVMQLIGQVQAPFANISGYLPRWYAMTASAERLMEAEGYEDDGEVADAEDMRRYYRERFRVLGLRRAAFRYPVAEGEAPAVLRDLTISIRKGEYVAFTGHSGCGKSTVLKLLMCMYPLDGGERYLDEGELTAYYRRLFAYVPQGNALMNGTIRDAVSFARPEERDNDEQLRRALEIACAAEFVEDLDAPLGERGSGLSEGQLQRLAIARAIFSEAPILLLDEATSALDEATERQLLDRLRAMTDRTVLIVTHRRAALGICDRVLRFGEDGVCEAERR